MVSAVERHHLTVVLTGSRAPSNEDVAVLVDDIHHLDPEVGEHAGPELVISVSVLAPSAAEARAYVDRHLATRRRGWISGWSYRAG